MNECILLFEEGKHQEAIICIQKKLDENPQDSELWFMLGCFFGIIEAHDKAIEAFDQAIALKPDHADAYCNKGNALSEIGVIWEERERLEEAAGAYDQAIALKPDHADAYYSKGVALYNIGEIWKERKRLEEAVEAYDQAIALKPGYADAYCNKGNALFEIGKTWKERKRLQEAVEVYDQMIALKSDFAEAYYNKGNALSDIGVIWEERKRLEEAVEAHDLAIALKPGYAEAYCNKGNALSDIGVIWEERKRLEEAVEAYDQAIVLKPDDAQAHSNKGNALVSFYSIFSEGKHLYSALRNYHRAFFLDHTSITHAHNFLYLITTYFNVPHFASRFLTLHPYLFTDSQKFSELEEIVRIYRNHRNRMVLVHKELKINHEGDELTKRFYLYRAIAEHMGGDPIAAFNYHDNILDNIWEENLQHQYYYAQNASDILHPNASAILDYALQVASEFLKTHEPESKQGYYAACLYMLHKDYEKAIGLLKPLTEQEKYLPAYFKLLECYHLTENEPEKTELANSIHQKGLLRKLSQKRTEETVCSGLDYQIEAFESWTGWYFAGMVIDQYDQEILDRNLPITSTKYYEDIIKGNQIDYQEATQQEINELDPERLEALIHTCREQMPHIFPKYEKAEKLNDNLIAEELLGLMQEEDEENGQVSYQHYVNLVLYCYHTSKISKVDYILITAFLNLRSYDFDKGNDDMLLKLISRKFFAPFIVSSAEVIGIPYLPTITKLISYLTNEYTLKGKNYFYFKRHYSELKNKEPNELPDALKVDKTSELLKDLFDGSSEES